MKTTTVLPGETLADVCIRVYLRLDALAAVAAANGLAMTADLTAGQVLAMPALVFAKPLTDKPGPAPATVRRATVQPSQTLADLAVQHCGSFAALPALAALNGLAITADVAAGTALLLPEVVDKRTAAVYRSAGYVPAVGRTDPALLLEGIDYWGIGYDFIVQ